MSEHSETQSPPAPPEKPGKDLSTVGMTGFFGGLLLGALILWGGFQLLDLFGVHGHLRTGLELGVMGLAIGGVRFLWKVDAVAGELSKEREAPEGASARPSDEG